MAANYEADVHIDGTGRRNSLADRAAAAKDSVVATVVAGAVAAKDAVQSAGALVAEKAVAAKDYVAETVVPAVHDSAVAAKGAVQDKAVAAKDYVAGTVVPAVQEKAAATRDFVAEKGASAGAVVQQQAAAAGAVLQNRAGGKKVIAVMGATGMQGGGVVDAILNDGTFACRAITRNASSEKALALKARGCEVVEGDADQPATLKQAFKGAEGAFLVTNFWEHHDQKREYSQAVGAADAAYDAGVKHIVFSTLENVDQHDNFRNVIPKIGDVRVPHFDIKARASQYMKSKLYPATYLYASFYMENFYFFNMLSRVDDSHYETVLPTSRADSKIAMVSMRDLGLMVLHVLKNRSTTLNQDVKVMGDMLSPKDIGALLQRAAGVDVAVKQPAPLEFAKYGFPGADDLGHMFLYFSEYEDVWATYQRVQNYHNFENFLKHNSKVLKEYISNQNAAAAKKKEDL